MAYTFIKHSVLADADEAVARRLECHEADEPVQPVRVGDVHGFQVGAPGAARLVFTASPAQAPHVIRRVAAHEGPLERMTVVVVGEQPHMLDNAHHLLCD